MRSASLETRHACAVPRTVAPYKYRATGDTVTKWERDVRGHLNKVGVGSAWSTIVTAQLATCPLHLESCCCRMAEERKARHPCLEGQMFGQTYLQNDALFFYYHFNSSDSF